MLSTQHEFGLAPVERLLWGGRLRISRVRWHAAVGQHHDQREEEDVVEQPVDSVVDHQLVEGHPTAQQLINQKHPLGLNAKK